MLIFAAKPQIRRKNDTKSDWLKGACMGSIHCHLSARLGVNLLRSTLNAVRRELRRSLSSFCGCHGNSSARRRRQARPRPTDRRTRRRSEWAAALSGIRRRGPRWRPRLKVMHATRQRFHSLTWARALARSQDFSVREPTDARLSAPADNRSLAAPAV